MAPENPKSISSPSTQEPSASPSSSDLTSPSRETSEHTLSAGTLIDHYRIKRMLGQGGMSVVYLARDLKLGRQVALKLIHPKDLEMWEAVPRFLQEARATAQFNHPHIVMIYTVGEYRGSPYLALEYLEGQTLRERLEERQLSLLETLRLLESVADALSETHRHQVLHCDLKPENLLLPRDGRLRILDFGLARFLYQTSSPDAPPEHWLSKVQGTAPYMAPEQWKQGARLTPATDTWAFGVLMFELLTGEVPFPGRSLHDLQTAIQTRPTPQLPEHVPPALRLLCQNCLSKDPAERPSMEECFERLREFRQPELQHDASKRNPFRGLSAYLEEHASQFFGREPEIELFLERLREQPILGVVGPSGCGKSSFLLAGVVPRVLEQQSWLVLKIRPHRQPFVRLAGQLIKTMEGITGSQQSLLEFQQTVHTEERLAEELRQQPRMLSLILHRLAEQRRQNVLLVLDQLEELITQVESANLRQRFIAALAWAAEDPRDPVRVLFSLRDDYLGRFAESSEAQQFLSQVMILRIPDATVLREIVQRPVQQLGYKYESEALVEQMINAVKGEYAGLPLLQFACRKMWEQRDRNARLLRESVYHQIGGVIGALSEHAEGVLQQMTEPQKQATRILLRRLVTAEGTRQLLPREEALENLGEDGHKICNLLIQARLLTVHQPQEGSSSEGSIEVAHESLLTQWKTFRRWLEEDREEIAFLQELTHAARLWDKRGKRQEETWSGLALVEALLFQQKYKAPLPLLVQGFLEASQVQQKQKERRRKSLYTLAAIVMTFVLLGLAGGTVLLDQKNRQISNRWALSQQATALSAFQRKDYISARVALRAAFEKYDSPALRSLWRRLKRTSLYWKESLGVPLHDVQFQPGGKWLAVATKFGVMLIHQMTGRRFVLRGHRQRVMRLAFSADGRWLASGSWDGEIRLWKKDRDRYRDSGLSLQTGKAPVESLRFSPDGTYLVSAGYEGVHVWNVRKNRHKKLKTGPARCLLFQNQHRLLVGGYHPFLRLYDFRTRQHGLVRTSPQQTRRMIRELRQLTLSSDKRWMAGVGGGSHLLLWSLPSFQMKVLRSSSKQRLTTLRFSRNNHWLMAGGAGKKLQLWKGPKWKLWREYKGHKGRILRLATSQKGNWFASVDHDQTLFLWRILPSLERKTSMAHLGGITSLSFGPGGKTLASAGEDSQIRLWDIRTGRLKRTLQGHRGSIRYVTISPDGEHLLSSSYDKSIRLWELNSGQIRQVFLGFLPYLFRVPFDSEGNRLATVRGPFVYIWKVMKKAHVTRLLADRRGKVDQVAFDPQGQYFATAGRDRYLRLWSLKTHKKLQDFPLPSRQIELVFSPNGKYLAASGSDHRIRLWKLDSAHPTKTPKTLATHKGFINRLAFGPFSRVLLSASFDGTIRVSPLVEGGMQKVLSGRHGTSPCRHFVHLAVHPRGELLAASCANHQVWMWNWKKNQPPRIGRLQRGALTGLQFSPQNGHLAVSSSEGEIRLWNTTPFRPAWRTTILLPRSHRLLTHRGWRKKAPGNSQWKQRLEKIAWKAVSDPKERWLLVQSSQKQVEFWDMKSDRMRWQRTIPSLRRFRLLKNGHSLLWSRPAGQWSGVLHWLDEKGQEVQRYKGLSAWYLHRDRVWIATAGELQELQKDRILSRIPLPLKAQPTHQRWVSALTPLQGGHWLLAYRSGQFRTLSTRAQPLRSFPSRFDIPPQELTHLKRVKGNVLLMGFSSGLVGLWSLKTGKKLESIRLHGAVQHLLWDGKSLLATSTTGDVIRWELKIFQTSYCKALQEIWKAIPFQKKGFLPEVRLPSHHCR